MNTTIDQRPESIHPNLACLQKGIWAVLGAHNALLDLEELEEKDLDKIRESYAKLARSAREEIKAGRVQTGRTDRKG